MKPKIIRALIAIALLALSAWALVGGITPTDVPTTKASK